MGSIDIVILILRSEYLRSDAYNQLLSRITNCTILPVLRSPIDILDWTDNDIINPIIDFTNYTEEHLTTGLYRLAEILSTQANIDTDTTVTTLDTNFRKLEAEVLRLLMPAYLLETVNYGRSSLQEHPIHKLLETMSFGVFSGLEKSTNKIYRTDSLLNIVKSRESCTINCGDIDTHLIAAYLVNTEREFFTHSPQHTFPLLLDTRNWNKEFSSTKWLYDQLGVKQAQIDDLQEPHVTVYAYGYEQSVNPNGFEEKFRKWWNRTSPALSLIMLCSATEYSLFDDSKELVIKQNAWNWDQLQHLCAIYPDRAFAKYMLSCDAEQSPHAHNLVQNPVLVAILLSVDYAQGIHFLDLSPKDYFEHLINNLWGLVRRNDYTAIEDGISKLGAIMTENCKTFVAYEDALSYMQSDSLLQRCIDIGLFVLESGKLHFSLSIIQHYFAALALVKYGVPSRLPSLTLNSQSARIPQKWDAPLILASQFSSSDKLDRLIRRIANSDPLLAIQCLVSSGQHNPHLYEYIIEKNLESLVNIGDFRTDFARFLYSSDISMARDILLEALRNGKWEVRQYAYQTIRGMKFPLMAGLIEALTSLNSDTKADIALVLKRIAANALPTLFHLLHYDDDITRCNAIWAIGEIADKASVPALVTLLDDNSVKVATLAARTIASSQDVCALPYLVNQLQHRHIVTRKAVADAIISLFAQQHDNFVKVIRQLDISMRRQIVIYLSSSKFNKLKIDLLLELTQDDDIDIRIAAIQALGPIKEDRVITRLKECLGDMSKSRLHKSSVSEIVSRIMSSVPHSENVSSLLDKSQTMNSSQIVKARLLNVKTHNSTHNDVVPSHSASDTILEDAYVVDILTQLRSRQWDTSNNAAKMLRDYMKSLRGNASSKVINQVLETLNDDDWVIRWTGVESLGWVGNIHVVPHLVQRLSDANWKVRVAAIRALAEIKDNSAIAGLSKLSTDTNTVVREAAAEALGYMDGKQAVVTLEVFANDSEDFVRLASVESLGRICDKVAMSALLTALKDTSEHVRWAAANGLMGIADATMLPKLIPSLSDIGGPYWEQKRICDVIIDILKKINTEEAKNVIVEWQTNQA